MECKCIGCGVKLQFDEPSLVGYSPKKETKYCQRCFRLSHYGDLSISMKNSIDQDLILDNVAKMDANIIWVVDLFDFESGFLDSLNRVFLGKKIILVLTKRDLLPDTVSEQKLVQFTNSRLKDKNIKIEKFIVTGLNAFESSECIIDAMNDIDNKEFIILGKANAGKSTLINNIIKQNLLTASINPGTTLDFNLIEFNDIKLYDTPGLLNNDSCLYYIDDKDLKTLVPTSKVKPTIYQIYENQSFALGGICKVDLITDTNSSIVFYLANKVKIHRGKYATSNDLWEKHYGEILAPVCDCSFKEFKVLKYKLNGQKSDIVINGLGWVCVDNIDEVIISVHQSCNITLRKAMI